METCFNRLPVLIRFGHMKKTHRVYDRHHAMRFRAQSLQSLSRVNSFRQLLRSSRCRWKTSPSSSQTPSPNARATSAAGETQAPKPSIVRSIPGSMSSCLVMQHSTSHSRAAKSFQKTLFYRRMLKRTEATLQIKQKVFVQFALTARRFIKNPPCILHMSF